LDFSSAWLAASTMPSLTPNFIFPIVSSPDAFAERIRRESDKWGKVIRDLNVTLE